MKEPNGRGAAEVCAMREAQGGRRLPAEAGRDAAGLVLEVPAQAVLGARTVATKAGDIGLVAFVLIAIIITLPWLVMDVLIDMLRYHDA